MFVELTALVDSLLKEQMRLQMQLEVWKRLSTSSLLLYGMMETIPPNEVHCFGGSMQDASKKGAPF